MPDAVHRGDRKRVFSGQLAVDDRLQRVVALLGGVSISFRALPDRAALASLNGLRDLLSIGRCQDRVSSSACHSAPRSKFLLLVHRKSAAMARAVLERRVCRGLLP